MAQLYQTRLVVRLLILSTAGRRLSIVHHPSFVLKIVEYVGVEVLRYRLASKPSSTDGYQWCFTIVRIQQGEFELRCTTEFSESSSFEGVSQCGLVSSNC